MVRTRQNSHPTQASPSTPQNERDNSDSTINKAATVISKAKRINKDALRRNVKAKMMKKRQKRAKMIHFDDQNHLSVISTQKLSCPICLQIFLQPILTPCGHAFCLHCIEESLKHKSSCSLCRKTVTLGEPMPSKIFKDIISKASFNALTQEQAEEYQKRKEAFALKEENRKISESVKQGDLIDFYLERVWREGQIIEIRQQNDQKILKIKAVHNQTKVAQLEIGSRLVAKYRTFTKEPPNFGQGSLFFFEFQDELFNSISNSVFFFLESPNQIEWFQMQAI